MKKVLFIAVLLSAFTIAPSAQEQPAGCPPGMFCYTRQEAIEIDRKLTEREALLKEKETWKGGTEKLLGENNNLKIDLAKTSGEIIGCKEGRIRDTAIIDVLLKYVRPKKVGVNLF